MSLEGKVIVVKGAAGVVGSGVVKRALEAGATVVGTSRRAEKLEALRERLGLAADAPFLPVAATFGSEEEAAAAKAAVDDALDGRPIDHAVSILGFIHRASAPTKAGLEDLRVALRDGLETSFVAAKAFLPSLKTREGSSYTLVSGGLAHIPPPMAELWPATLKNAAVNALSHGLAAETAEDAVRVNTVCIHFSVAPLGGAKNQLGMPADDDTGRLGPAFLGLMRSSRKGEIVCLHDWATADALAAE